MPSGPRANSHQAAIGLCILLLGVFLVLDRLDIVAARETLRYWPVGLIILGLSVIIQAGRQDAAHVRTSVPWGAIFLLLIAGFVGTRVFERQAAAPPQTAESPSIFAVLGGDKRSAGPGFRSASITAVMGGAQLDLRKAEPGPGEELSVDVFNLMGGSIIYAPPGWIVDVRAVAIMGGINDQRGERAERRRRGNRQEGIDVDYGVPPAPGDPAGGPATAPPDVPGAPVAPPPPPPPPPAPPDPERIDVEAETPPPAPPRLIIRGFVGMGGLVIKSV